MVKEKNCQYMHSYLLLCLVACTALATDASTSCGRSCRSPRQRIQTPCFIIKSLKRTNKILKDGCTKNNTPHYKFLMCVMSYFSSSSLATFCLASSINPSTSSFDRLKFSILNAYTVTSVTPRSRPPV